MSDENLVRQALAGKSGAYEQLVRRWSPRVTAVCHARLGRHGRNGRVDSIEDLAQETLLRGLRSLPTLTDPAKFGNWICGIASRACLDWLKSNQRSEVSMSALDGDDSGEYSIEDDSHVPNDVEQHDEIDRLLAEVERLPLPYREVLMHYYYEDWTYERLAELLGISPATVNMRLTKARQLLRERLKVGKV